jgi:hypothetical protein
LVPQIRYILLGDFRGFSAKSRRHIFGDSRDFDIGIRTTKGRHGDAHQRGETVGALRKSKGFVATSTFTPAEAAIMPPPSRRAAHPATRLGQPREAARTTTPPISIAITPAPSATAGGMAPP